MTAAEAGQHLVTVVKDRIDNPKQRGRRSISCITVTDILNIMKKTTVEELEEVDSSQSISIGAMTEKRKEVRTLEEDEDIETNITSRAVGNKEPSDNEEENDNRVDETRCDRKIYMCT